MTNCYNCGHAGTFVLLAQFAIAVPDDGSDGGPEVTHRSESPPDSRPPDLSLAVQCPACDSTDVGVTPGYLLARYGSSTTS